MIDDKALRTLAYRWFHNIEDLWIVADFKKLFGARKGSTGHAEPKLDDDGWSSVDKATKILDERFAAWLKKK